jgi:predicted Zn-dependent peptidase
VGCRLKQSASISISVCVKTGSRFESSLEKGYSHFIEHMLFRGTKHRTGYEIARQVDKLGGIINAATTREYTYLFLTIIYSRADFAFDLLSDMIFFSRFQTSQCEKEKKIVLEEIYTCYDSPEEFTQDKFTELAFPKHPLGGNILGNTKSISACNSVSLKKFMREMYHPENILVSIAGNIRKEEVESLAKKYFFRRSRESKLISDKKRKTINRNYSHPEFKGGRYHVNRNTQQVHICFGLPSIPQNSLMREALYVFDNLFGGSMSSLLFQEVREQLGLCYSIDSFYSMFKDAGVFGVYCSTSSENFKKTIDEIYRRLKNFSNKFLTEEKLEESKLSICGRIMLGLETSESIMMDIALQEVLYREYISPGKKIKKIQSVTIDMVKKLVDDMCSCKNPLLLSVGKLNKKMQNYFPSLVPAK